MAVDKDSPTWRAVRDHAIRAIEAHRDALERPEPEADANAHRGRIAAYREILALADPKPPIADASRLY